MKQEPRKENTTVRYCALGHAACRAGSNEVARSWERCQALYRMDPSRQWRAEVLTSTELRQVNDSAAPLLRVGLPEIQSLFGLVRDLGLMVLLSDARAVLLARCISDSHRAVCRRLHLQEGAVWDEGLAGTNGVGTALREGCSVALTRGDHWRFCFALLESHAVPVFDGQGQLAGALNLASFGNESTRPVAPLLREALFQAARRMEEQLLRGRYPGQRIMTLGPARGSSGPLVAVNEAGDIVGATHAARTMLGWGAGQASPPEGPSGKYLTGTGVLATRPCGVERVTSFREAEEHVIRTALGLARGNVSAAARHLGISRATLYRKLRALEVVTPQSRG